MSDYTILLNQLINATQDTLAQVLTALGSGGVLATQTTLASILADLDIAVGTYGSFIISDATLHDYFALIPKKTCVGLIILSPTVFTSLKVGGNSGTDILSKYGLATVSTFATSGLLRSNDATVPVFDSIQLVSGSVQVIFHA
jgi:hypothetical protein